MRRICLTLLAAVLAAGLCACVNPGGESDGVLHIAATTYPVYLFTTAITDGVEGVTAELMINQPTSCLHDYTLTIRDMKILDRADIVAVSGGGLEAFLSSALAQTGAPVIDCSDGVALLPAGDHEDHGHDEEYDPHYWLSRDGARVALEHLAAELSRLDPEHGADYEENLASALAELDALEPPPAAACPWLITFHDGFRYFAGDCGLTILKAIEEEEGAEASAAELKEVLALVREYRLPAVFTEVNGSDSAARAIARETGCRVIPLNMVMSGEGTGLGPYLEAMRANYAAIADGLAAP